MRRWIVIGAAIILGVVGTFVLVSYVQNAEERALEGQELATVLVVTQPIPEGTPADSISGAVGPQELPVEAVAARAVSNLEDLVGLVASTDLVVGEQLLASRFHSPADAAVATRPEVSPELLQVTIPLEPARALGGRLVPGDLVSVIASFDSFNLNTAEPGDAVAIQDVLDQIVVVGAATGADGTSPLQSPKATHLVIHKVLVTGIQVQNEPRESPDGATAVEYAPTGGLLITLAAHPDDIEKIVFTMEHGMLWLALENAETPEDATAIITRENIFR